MSCHIPSEFQKSKNSVVSAIVSCNGGSMKSKGTLSTGWKQGPATPAGPTKLYSDVSLMEV